MTMTLMIIIAASADDACAGIHYDYHYLQQQQMAHIVAATG